MRKMQNHFSLMRKPVDVISTEKNKSPSYFLNFNEFLLSPTSPALLPHFKPPSCHCYSRNYTFSLNLWNFQSAFLTLADRPFIPFKQLKYNLTTDNTITYHCLKD